MKATSNLSALHVSTSDRGGGAELSARNLHQGLRERGVTSWLAVGRRVGDDENVFVIPNERHRGAWVRFWRRFQQGTVPGSLANRAIGALAWAGEPLRYLDVRLRGREDFSFPGTRHLLELPPCAPDIVHCHNLHGGYFDLRELPWLTHSVPTVIDLRDEWLLTGHCAYAVECRRWLTGCGECPDLSAYPAVARDSTAFNWMRKQAILRSSRLYLSAPSRWLLDRALRVMPNALAARVIPNAIETDIFHPGSMMDARERCDLPQNAPVVLTSAQHLYKDLSTTLEAVSSVTVKGRSPERAQLIVLGQSGEKRAAGDWDVQFLGFVSDRALVAEYFRAADVFVHGARAEAFGKTIAEAMACGTPTVASRVGGTPEVLEDGETGFLVAPSNAQELTRAITHVLQDGTIRETLGARAIEVARVKYSLQRQVCDVVDYYAMVVDDWHTRGRAR